MRNEKNRGVRQILTIDYWKGFKGKFIFWLSAVFSIAALFLWVFLPGYFKTNSIENFVAQNKTMSMMLFESIELSLEFEDYETVQEVFNNVGNSKDVLYCELKDGKGNTLALYWSNNSENTENYILDSDGLYFSDEIMIQQSLFNTESGEYSLYIGLNIEPLTVALEKVSDMIGLSLLLVAISLSIVIMILTEILVKPLYMLIDRLEDIVAGEGDLTAELSINSNDEFGRIGELFNMFRLKVSDIIIAISESSKNLLDTMATVVTAASELSHGAEEQQTKLAEVAVSVEQINELIHQSSDNAEETLKQVKITADSANNGRESVSKTVEGFDIVVLKVEKAVENIKELNERSEKIGGVVRVIDDIADQTNLLALNASIEAARAGDAGRGFTVVADEVRNLAVKTVGATKEIGEIIKQIQLGIKGTVNSIEEIHDQSKDGLELAADSDNALINIVDAMGDIIHAVEIITEASNNQNKDADDISRIVDEVASFAKQTGESAHSLSGSATVLDEEVNELNDMIGQFKVSSNHS